MTIQSAFAELVAAIRPIYDAREAANIAHMVMEHITGLGKLDRIVHKDGDLTQQQAEQYEAAKAALLEHRPVQHITGKSWFYGLELQVSEQVLIPRPETEELVEWVLLEYPSKPALRLLDIGTGSGSIPIALKKQWPSADVWAMDVSTSAIAIATRNASQQHAPIRFIQQDVLAPDAANVLPTFNVIVSNPPYIPLREKTGMQRQVEAYEPGIALFVPDDDPLLFYRTIARLAVQKLEPNGRLYVEIHESYGPQVVKLLQDLHFRQIELRKDMFGKDRMVRAVGPQ
ncbi:peptide chain release factor N(5)-glutamine methyltransferase [Chitinophaga lutea]